MSQVVTSDRKNEATSSNALPFLRISVHVQTMCLSLADMATLAVCALLAWWLKYLTDSSLPVDQYLSALPLALCVQLLVFWGMGLYPGIGLSAAEELRRLSYAVAIVFGMGVVVTFIAKAGEVWSRQIMLMAWFFALVSVPIARALIRRACCRNSWWGIPCAVIGAGATGRQVVALLRSRPWLGLRPIVVLDDDASSALSNVLGVPIAGPVASVTHVLAQRGLQHGILAMPSLPGQALSRMLDGLGKHLRHIHITPALPGCPDIVAETREFAHTLMLDVRQNLLRPEVRFLKRSLDIVFIGVVGLCIMPIVLVIMLLVKSTSPGPIFYGQTRIGSGGKEFKAWKFRSMVYDADAELKSYFNEHPELLEEWERDHKLKNDPRITWVGRILRRTSLDELPQFWNILAGDMSLVGPRPIVQDEVEKYGERFSLYTKVRPGLSGLWQVSGRNDTTYVKRVALDCYYVRNWSVWLDLVILARTISVVVLGKGAY